jgi:hypothetical protein
MRELGAVWVYVADTSCGRYSPLYDSICRTVAASDELLDLVEQAPPPGHFPILLLAAAHYLVLGGVDHPLADVYAGRSGADPGPLFVDLCLAHRDEVLDLLATRAVNTNEVGRSAVIGPALTAAASRATSPVALLDVGCSAGLNLLADCYRLDYGVAGATGPADAAVRVDCAVVGGEPPIGAQLPPIGHRVGLDRDPVDLDDDDAIRWQLACVWPDTGRLPRTRAALAAARDAGLVLVKGDAVDDVFPVIESLPADATAVVVTTGVVGYFTLEQRAGFHDVLREASRRRPIAWISSESQGVVAAIPTSSAPSDDDGVELSVLGLVRFADGAAEGELLGYAHPHGSTLDWRAAGAR